MNVAQCKRKKCWEYITRLPKYEKGTSTIERQMQSEWCAHISGNRKKKRWHILRIHIQTSHTTTLRYHVVGRCVQKTMDWLTQTKKMFRFKLCASRVSKFTPEFSGRSIFIEIRISVSLDGWKCVPSTLNKRMSLKRFELTGHVGQH